MSVAGWLISVQPDEKRSLLTFQQVHMALLSTQELNSFLWLFLVWVLLPLPMWPFFFDKLFLACGFAHYYPRSFCVLWFVPSSFVIFSIFSLSFSQQGDKGILTSPKGNSQNVNEIFWLESELTHYDVKVLYIIHYAMETSPYTFLN